MSKFSLCISDLLIWLRNMGRMMRKLFLCHQNFGKQDVRILWVNYSGKDSIYSLFRQSHQLAFRYKTRTTLLNTLIYSGRYCGPTLKQGYPIYSSLEHFKTLAELLCRVVTMVAWFVALHTAGFFTFFFFLIYNFKSQKQSGCEQDSYLMFFMGL